MSPLSATLLGVGLVAGTLTVLAGLCCCCCDGECWCWPSDWEESSFSRFSSSATRDLLGRFLIRGGAGGREKQSFLRRRHLRSAGDGVRKKRPCQWPWQAVWRLLTSHTWSRRQHEGYSGPLLWRRSCRPWGLFEPPRRRTPRPWWWSYKTKRDGPEAGRMASGKGGGGMQVERGRKLIMRVLLWSRLHHRSRGRHAMARGHEDMARTGAKEEQ